METLTNPLSTDMLVLSFGLFFDITLDLQQLSNARVLNQLPADEQRESLAEMARECRRRLAQASTVPVDDGIPVPREMIASMDMALAGLETGGQALEAIASWAQAADTCLMRYA